MQATLIFPHQLFEYHPCLAKDRVVIIHQHPLFFTQLPFHKQKLVLHFASIQYYKDKLEKEGYKVFLLTYKEKTEQVFHLCKKLNIEQIFTVYPDDFLLEKWLDFNAKKFAIRLTFTENPQFITPLAKSLSLVEGKRLLMNDFYTKQRKYLNILLDEAGKPLGGKWSFDHENRLKFPANYQVVSRFQYAQNQYVIDAKAFVSQHFKDNFGQSEGFNYPVTHQQARVGLQDFLHLHFAKFGTYQDAIAKHLPFGHHSLLSSALNIGLLTENQVIEAVLLHIQAFHVPLHSVEGFIRQIIGWRNYIRVVYHLKGVQQRNTNFFQYNNKIPSFFWTGKTDILPLKQSFQHLERYAYCHHIERLMVLGNFLLLVQIDPDEVYRWFMTVSIDAYDWIMVPNVYGMSQYADGGLITTKPYVSASNYLLKMSDFPKGKWTGIWDSLYWNFIANYSDIFSSNMRMKMMIALWNKKPKEIQEILRSNAQIFLDTLQT